MEIKRNYLFGWEISPVTYENNNYSILIFNNSCRASICEYKEKKRLLFGHAGKCIFDCIKCVRDEYELRQYAEEIVTEIFSEYEKDKKNKQDAKKRIQKSSKWNGEVKTK